MSKNVKELKGKLLNPNLDYKEEKLKEKLLNSNLDYRNELKQLLIRQLREHQLDFNLEGEGDNEVITLSRQAVVLANSNEELSSLIVKCIQSNIKINLLGLANKLMNARITRPVFSERTVTIADQQEMMFEMKDGKIDSTKSLKALNNKYSSEGVEEFDKSTEVRTACNYRLPMLLTEMNKAGVISDELKNKLLDPNADYNLEGNSYEARKEAHNKMMQDFKDNGRKREQAQKVLSDFCRGKDLWNIEGKPVIKTGLEGSFRNPNLDYKVSGEGLRQIITIPRATLFKIKYNE